MKTKQIRLAIKMKIGDKFDSFQELTEKIQDYEKINFVKLYIRDSRKLEAAKRRYPKLIEQAKPELVYCEIKYICIRGGTFNTKGKGIRKTKTFRNDCTSYIKIGLSKDGTSLEVKSMNNNHNHEVSKELFQLLPQQRKLSEHFETKAAMLLDSGIDKRKIQQQLSSESGQVILSRDLTNISQRKKNSKMKNPLIKIISELTSKWNASVDIYTDFDNVFQGLFFQDSEMKRLFQCYPEIIFCNVTYKLLDINMACFFMAIEDSNGESEIVCVGILVNDDLESFKWLLDTFKKHNAKYNDIKVIMTDKNFKNRNVFKNVFPNSKLLFSIFHILQIFRSEISQENMNISYSERVCSLKMLQKMAYSKTETEYDDLYEEFKESVPPQVLNYYYKNWHLIRYEWVLGISCIPGNFFETTNNRIESLNAKLKSVINCSTTLEGFIDAFFSQLNVLRQQKDHVTAQLFLKRPSKIDNASSNVSSDEKFYQSYLTPYAFKYIERQFTLLRNINDDDIIEKGNEFIIESDEQVHIVKADHCTCSFKNSMHLPCYHILALRRKTHLPVFSEDLCASRWSMEYYKTCQRVFLNDNLNLLSKECASQSIISNQPKILAKTASDRHKLSFSLANEIASITSTTSSDKFDERIEILKELIDNWKDGKEVKLVPLNRENRASISNQNLANEPTNISISPSRNEIISCQEIESEPMDTFSE